MTSFDLLVRDNVRLLEQGIAMIEGLEAGLYGAPVPALASSGIGSHVRHCVDFYDCFLRGVGEGRIDFDRRERDPRLETDAAYASGRLRDLVGRMRSVSSPGCERPLEVKTDCGGEDEEDLWTRSSCERELAFLKSHTVHHYALIAALLRSHGLEPHAELGVAPSTLRYWKESEACAR